MKRRSISIRRSDGAWARVSVPRGILMPRIKRALQDLGEGKSVSWLTIGEEQVVQSIINADFTIPPSNGAAGAIPQASVKQVESGES